MKQDSDFYKFINSANKNIIVFDGAMGTSLQELNLSASDYGGKELEGCNENLIITNPSVVEQVHKNFLEAGCNVIETNTFGATSIVLEEYNIASESAQINYKAAQLAKKVSSKYSTKEKPRFVAGSMGPTTKLPTLGHILFDDLVLSYEEQSTNLIKGGVDLIVIETCQDILQIKAALLAVKNSFRITNIEIPIMVSVTVETTGTLLIGTEISAIVNILETFNIDILGLNCATGPEQMKPHIKYLSENSPFKISCVPNAGLPENIGGKAHYMLSPIELKMQLMHFIKDLGVTIIGGCCGTTPKHISELVKLSSEITPKELEEETNNNLSGVSSIYEMTTYKQDSSILIIGERLNASGSKKVRTLLNDNNWDGLLSIAKEQVNEQAHVLDVNVDYVGRDGIKDMEQLISKLVTNINIPIMIDSTDYQKMEAGLKKAGGKCILNSTNYEDGPDRFYKVLDLCKNFGSSVVIGTIDEEGMARKCEDKLSIVDRSYVDTVNFGIKERDIFYDPLVLPISTGLEEDRKNACETIKSIGLIRKKYPNVHITLGISNVSFGLTPAARITLNSVFLEECIKAGLDSAIISPAKILPMKKIRKEHLNVCLDLIYDKRKFENNICTYDPLTELTTLFSNISTTNLKQRSDELDKLPLEKRLSMHIIDGEKNKLEKNLQEALNKYDPLEIVNSYLLEGMKVVGDLFASGKMQLPFVLQSAETMKYAVSILEPYMEKDKNVNASKGKFLIATVKGDVHDIGKNLVDIILSNNGFEVINLGIKQDVSEIIKAQKIHNADCIAMSGLLVKSTAFMKENLEILNQNLIDVPVILGGAALTPKFVNKDCNNVYKGIVIYGKDAFTDLRFIEALMKSKRNSEWDNIKGFLNGIPEGINISPKTIVEQIINKNHTKETKDHSSNRTRSQFIIKEASITPPFIGTRILDKQSISFDKLIFYLDKNALFSGQWQFKRATNQTKEEFRDFINTKGNDILYKWLDIIEKERLIDPAIVYGYFPCSSSQNDLYIYDTKNSNKLGEFNFPRQKGNRKYCIADFFNTSNDNKPQDFIPMQAVTIGEVASIYSQKLFKQNKYSDYLYFHGITVQLTEALAELAHANIRRECGFSLQEPETINGVLAQKYRGCRYSFGYPACPNVSDSKKQLVWLKADRIKIAMDESDQLFPEQSTTAIISLHSQAKYFSA